MFKNIYPHLLAIGSLAGTIIGLGMFGVPFVASRAGIGSTLFYLILIGGIMSLVHSMYLEVTMRTKETHRFVGYTGIYLGSKWKAIASIVSIITLWGTLLIYIIIGGKFINVATGLSFVSAEFWSSIAFFVLAGYAVARPPRTIGKIEAFFALGIIFVVVLFFIKGFFGGQIDVSNFVLVNWSNWFLPYGVIIFALGGASIIPSIENILEKEIEGGKKIHFGKIGILGTMIPVVVYAIFMFVVVGISGDKTSEEALVGMEEVLGNGYVKIAALVGCFALITSFIALGNELKRVFWNDYHLSQNVSLFLTLSIPFILFFLNLAGFIQVMGLLGAVIGIFVYVVIIVLFYRAKKMGDCVPLFSFNFPKALAWIVVAVFIGGGILSLM